MITPQVVQQLITDATGDAKQMLYEQLQDNYHTILRQQIYKHLTEGNYAKNFDDETTNVLTRVLTCLLNGEYESARYVVFQSERTAKELEKIGYVVQHDGEHYYAFRPELYLKRIMVKYNPLPRQPDNYEVWKGNHAFLASGSFEEAVTIGRERAQHFRCWLFITDNKGRTEMECYE